MRGSDPYEQLYCARGDMENRIKEQQLALFADRTSSATLRANQLRLYWSTLAYVLLHALRTRGLAATPAGPRPMQHVAAPAPQGRCPHPRDHASHLSGECNRRPGPVVSIAAFRHAGPHGATVSRRIARIACPLATAASATADAYDPSERSAGSATWSRSHWYPPATAPRTATETPNPTTNWSTKSTRRTSANPTPAAGNNGRSGAPRPAGPAPPAPTHRPAVHPLRAVRKHHVGADALGCCRHGPRLAADTPHRGRLRSHPAASAPASLLYLFGRELGGFTRPASLVAVGARTPPEPGAMRRPGVEQILGEPALGRPGVERRFVAVTTPQVEPPGAALAEAADLAVVENPQQLGLRARRQFGHLVERDRAAG